MQPLKVLIVDDIEAMRKEFISIFRDYVSDARIDEAPDVISAIERCQTEKPPYDVVFTDVNMPAVSGLRLIPFLRNHDIYRRTPLIVMSTLTGRTDIARALELGATAYLTRPFQREYFEIIYLAYITPILRRKTNS
jgi:CheY-like chemotaxis protein